VEVIDRSWDTVVWLDPRREAEIAQAKTAINERMLQGLSLWTAPGQLLDFGCNFGQFLKMAGRAGWEPHGFEPNASAADAARAKGFNVRSGWTIQEAGFSEASFDAIAVNDVFCFVWEPMNTLEHFFRILRPGGVLVMRLTNKRMVMGLIRAFSRPGPRRDERISKILQGQFHSIGLNSFSRILRNVGFNRIQVQPRAMTAPWSCVGWRTKIAYFGADLLHLASLKSVNLSPGVLLYAQKPR
jgi:SAM-dependent methyltransferase